MVVVLLPFPNIFGILLDGALLAVANPLVGDGATLALVFVYNFNPVKLNGVIGLYYVIYGIVRAGLARLLPSVTPTLVSAVDVGTLLLLSGVEYLVIKDASGTLWRRLTVRHPAFPRSTNSPGEATEAL